MFFLGYKGPRGVKWVTNAYSFLINITLRHGGLIHIQQQDGVYGVESKFMAMKEHVTSVSGGTH